MVIAVLRLVRWPNLLIIAAAQLLIYFRFIHHSVPETSLLFSCTDNALLVICTLLVAGAGFVINDIFDQKTDAVNRKKNIVPKLISVRGAYQIYFSMIFLGTLISIYLAWKYGFLMSWMIFPATNLLLYLYSSSLKCSLLLGNIAVSVFIGFSLLLIPYANWQVFLNENFDNKWFAIQHIAILTSFAVCSNLFREIIKDIEDIDGDRSCDCKTLAVVYGSSAAKMIAASVLMILFGIEFLYFLQSNDASTKLKFGVLILLPLIVLTTMLIKAKEKKQFHQVSIAAKWYMLIGMIYFLLY